MISAALADRYPVVIGDEHQDSSADQDAVMMSLHHAGSYLRVFGDPMQRIYGEGMANLAQKIPDDWAKPAKQMNHRSAKRLVRLANKMREMADAHAQLSRSDRPEGTVRFFAVAASSGNKQSIERFASEHMAEITCDKAWLSPGSWQSAP